MKVALPFVLAMVPLGQALPAEYFTPAHRVAGIGIERDDLSTDLLGVRADLMVQSQTFAIMRDPRAVPGAQRITGDSKLQSIFRSAAAKSGLPASLLEGVAYLESWGDAKAESPAGPRGIMQISLATAREMGLKVISSTRFRVTTEKLLVKNKRGKWATKTVRHKVPYTVAVRDDRLSPDRAIPAAAMYLANLERRYGSRDWAIFAYHCGEGCAAEVMDLARHARGIPKDQLTVARMFFSCSPAWNRELYQALQIHMQRDYSPTYWFRVQKAQQLLDLYRRDPDSFLSLSQQYKSDFVNGVRAPHRLSVWLKREDMLYHNAADIRAQAGTKLVKAFDRPEYFGYRLRLAPGPQGDPEYFSQASPSAVGTLTYIAFETRRLWEAMRPKNEKFKVLEVTSLVEPEDDVRIASRSEGLSHTSGEVFDIAYDGLPSGEYECLRFVLDDLGWEGYIGFVEEGRDNLHIGCAPAVRDFFTTVFLEALSKQPGGEVKTAASSLATQLQ